MRIKMSTTTNKVSASVSSVKFQDKALMAQALDVQPPLGRGRSRLEIKRRRHFLTHTPFALRSSTTPAPPKPISINMSDSNSDEKFNEVKSVSIKPELKCRVSIEKVIGFTRNVPVMDSDAVMSNDVKIKRQLCNTQVHASSSTYKRWRSQSLKNTTDMDLHYGKGNVEEHEDLVMMDNGCAEESSVNYTSKRARSVKHNFGVDGSKVDKVEFKSEDEKKDVPLTNAETFSSDDEALDEEKTQPLSSDDEDDNLYTPGSNKFKIRLNYAICGVSDFKNFDATKKYVYFKRHDFDAIAKKFGREQSIWNQEYPGCFISRVKSSDINFGFLDIEAKTIRPFEYVQSHMLIWVIVGEVVLVTNVLDLLIFTKKERYIFKRTTYKAGECIVLPGGIPFSLENHTKCKVNLSYSCNSVE